MTRFRPISTVPALHPWPRRRWANASNCWTEKQGECLLFLYCCANNAVKKRITDLIKRLGKSCDARVSLCCALVPRFVIIHYSLWIHLLPQKAGLRRVADAAIVLVFKCFPMPPSALAGNIKSNSSSVSNFERTRGDTRIPSIALAPHYLA